MFTSALWGSDAPPEISRPHTRAGLCVCQGRSWESPDLWLTLRLCVSRRCRLRQSFQLSKSGRNELARFTHPFSSGWKTRRFKPLKYVSFQPLADRQVNQAGTSVLSHEEGYRLYNYPGKPVNKQRQEILEI